MKGNDTDSEKAGQTTTAPDGKAACRTDFSTTCPTCGASMQPEHAHYRCLRCGYRDSCCM